MYFLRTGINRKNSFDLLYKEPGKNLNQLGHITMSFTGDSTANLPGTLYLEAKEIPEITEGTEIAIA